MIAVTSGEPAGIGPDLCALLAHERFRDRVVFLGDREVIAARAKLRKVAFVPESVMHVSASAPVVPGRLDAANARYVLAMLDRAISGCRSGEFGAIVTAPVQKSTINEAGVAFTGHTEYLADKTGTARVVMMLVGGRLRVALATTHLPLADVPRAITRESLDVTLRILDHDLRSRFGIAKPRILVAGLNPHAGESGHLGHEEIDVIAPAIDAAVRNGLSVRGPFPADTLFTPRLLEQADAVLAMYHDQGLPVLKHAAFGDAVNVTLGLPIVRTSVDHGTAVDLAGTGVIDTGSLKAAIELAIDLAARR
ncbi:4-hydroxythreonine-4-phosphate dehydrogenase PdxA [Usitatibacter palustris]|uniref:4-hydroxythreonine-4-phosphate dehydrogenase n=1 Tax=Usitatibacter palustris TaxID=2732487 RepID=A0A6M4H2I9_9PROT|nr:4-hydroxythreonine-4-phosphate dehydrogenase PdxA [Usitatibacter palustris]QJR13680.1 4-hydroxythreonine-4-phosphate dehydrogenase [Usitatibacter palustris]